MYPESETKTRLDGWNLSCEQEPVCGNNTLKLYFKTTFYFLADLIKSIANRTNLLYVELTTVMISIVIDYEFVAVSFRVHVLLV